MKTKEDVLKENGWEEFVGYCFNTPKADDNDMLTFVDKAEVERVLTLGVQTYWWNYNKDRLYDFEEAWECFSEDYCDEHDLDFNTQKEIDDYLLGGVQK